MKSIKFKFIVGLILFSFILQSYTALAASLNLSNYFEDFESYEAEDSPEFSGKKSGMTMTVKSDVADDTNKYLSFDYDKTSTAHWFQISSATDLAGDIVIGTKLRVNTDQTKSEFRVEGANIQNIITFKHASTGGNTATVAYFEGNSIEVPSGFTYNLGQWYDVVIRFNTTEFTYSFWIDGMLIQSDKTYYNDTSKGKFKTFNYQQSLNGSGKPLKTDLDDIRISTLSTPKVRKVYPKKGESNVNVLTPITLGFNNPMANLSSDNIVLKNVTSGAVVDYDGHCDGVNYIITPIEPLDINAEYSVNIVGAGEAYGAKDIFSQDMESDFDITHFTTNDESFFVVSDEFTDSQEGAGNVITLLENNGYVRYNLQLANASSQDYNGILSIKLYNAEDVLVGEDTKTVTVPKGKETFSIGLTTPGNVDNHTVKVNFTDDAGNIIHENVIIDHLVTEPDIFETESYGMFDLLGNEILDLKSVLVSDNKKTVTGKVFFTNGYKEAKPALIMMAVYKNDVLKDFRYKEALILYGKLNVEQKISLDLPDNTDGYEVHLFVWEDIGGMKQIVNSKIIN